MTDRERVIGHLGILRTWCAVNPKYGMALSIEDCDNAVGWLKEHADNIAVKGTLAIWQKEQEAQDG